MRTREDSSTISWSKAYFVKIPDPGLLIIHPYPALNPFFSLNVKLHLALLKSSEGSEGEGGLAAFYLLDFNLLCGFVILSAFYEHTHTHTHTHKTNTHTHTQNQHTHTHTHTHTHKERQVLMLPFVCPVLWTSMIHLFCCLPNSLFFIIDECCSTFLVCGALYIVVVCVCVRACVCVCVCALHANQMPP